MVFIREINCKGPFYGSVNRTKDRAMPKMSAVCAALKYQSSDDDDDEDQFDMDEDVEAGGWYWRRWFCSFICLTQLEFMVWVYVFLLYMLSIFSPIGENPFISFKKPV